MQAAVQINASSQLSDSDFDLDIETIASGPVVAGLLNDTSDGCTSTCQSACANSTCIGG